MSLRDEIHPIPVDQWEYFGGRCGHCGRSTTFALIAAGKISIETQGDWRPMQLPQAVMACSGCWGVSVEISDGPDTIGRYPTIDPGNFIEGLEPDVRSSWDEARRALGAHCPVAAEHMCRKILIHVAAGVPGAPPNMSFQRAVDFLVESKTITEPMKAWVDKIREHGNEAAHELESPDEARALVTLEFTEQLLRIVYETKHRLHTIAAKATAKAAKTLPVAAEPPSLKK
jgi:hypothetical protein